MPQSVKAPAPSEMTVDEYRNKYNATPRVRTRRKLGVDTSVEDDFLKQIQMAGLIVPLREHKGWHEEKLLTIVKKSGSRLSRVNFKPYLWRFDFALPDIKVAIEIEGGGFSHGKHHRPAGYEKDCVKYDEAALLGWTVLRFTPGLVQCGYALQIYEKALISKNQNL